MAQARSKRTKREEAIEIGRCAPIDHDFNVVKKFNFRDENEHQIFAYVIYCRKCGAGLTTSVDLSSMSRRMAF